jgi:hypothetical protein
MKVMLDFRQKIYQNVENFECNFTICHLVLIIFAKQQKL